MMRCGDWRFVVACIGFAVMIGSFVVMSLTFFYAFFFNNMRFSIAINLFGEASLECVLLMLSVPCVLYSIRYYAKKVVFVRQGRSVGVGQDPTKQDNVVCSPVVPRMMN